MNIAVAANEAFGKYLYVMLTSLLENNSASDKVCDIYLLSADFKDEQIDSIKNLVKSYHQNFHFIHIDKSMFPVELPFSEKITIETYFRLALPDLLPQDLERVLYLDVDLIVNQPLRELYEMDFEEKYFIACHDMTAISAQYVADSQLFAELRDTPGFQYFNAGVLLFNLKKLREINSFQLIMSQAPGLKEHLKFHDQDLLNYIFWENIKYVDTKKFNLVARSTFNMGYHYPWVKEHTVILHYAGSKPWDHKCVRYDLEKFWWDYAKMTPYYTELLENMVLPEIDTGYMDQLFRSLKQENDELKQIVDKCMYLLETKLKT